eukprot:s225_g21.t1
MTLQALQNFCCPSVPPNYGGLLNSSAKKERECDYALLKKLTQKVECMAADAAADELSGTWPGSVLGKDRAHAAQRMLSRPWAADGVLKEVVAHFVEKLHSIARLINNSEAVKDLYADFRKKTDELIHSNACLETLAFLTPEKALLSAMLADGALELHRVVRAFDAEELLLAPGFRCTFGGPGTLTQDVTRDCLKRMSAYVVVAESVLEGEFPTFQLVSSLRAFSLSDSYRTQRQLESGERNNCLEKLAQAIGVDAEALSKEV